MSPLLYVRLSAMMFLQYSVWAFWLPVFNNYMNEVGIDESLQGLLFATYGYGALIGPFLIGQLADRFFASERVLAGCHLLGGLLLWAASESTEFWPLFIFMLLHCTLYMPTMGLTQSVTFQALGDDQRHVFAWVRLWGTVGWIVTSYAFGEYLKPETIETVPVLQSLQTILGDPSWKDSLRFPALLSMLYALYCLTLPNTPPSPSSEQEPTDRKVAALETLKLMGDRSFAVLVTITAVVGVMLAFYFGCENAFLVSLGVEPSQAGQLMAIGQGAELILMFFVPLVVKKLGIKWTMVLGATAWMTRFAISAIAGPDWMTVEYSPTWWLIVGTIGLHGFAFGFFFVPAFMYVDRVAPSDVRATAQNYLILLVYGFGSAAGSMVTGPLRKIFAPQDGSESNWMAIWSGPTILTAVAVLGLIILFRERKSAIEDDHQVQDQAKPLPQDRTDEHA